MSNELNVHEGELLLQWLQKIKKKAPWLADELGVTKANVYYHIKQPVMAEEFKSRLKSKGYVIPSIIPENKIDSIVHDTKTQYQKRASTAILLEDVTIMHVPLVSQYAYAGYLAGYGDHEYIDGLPSVPFIVDREGRGNYIAF